VVYVNSAIAGLLALLLASAAVSTSLLLVLLVGGDVSLAYVPGWDSRNFFSLGFWLPLMVVGGIFAAGFWWEFRRLRKRVEAPHEGGSPS
jgi:uncharacterized membrane protein